MYSLFVLVNNSVDGCGMVCGPIDPRCILADPAPIVPVETQRGADATHAVAPILAHRAESRTGALPDGL